MVVGREIGYNGVGFQTNGDNEIFGNDNAERKSVIVYVAAQEWYIDQDQDLVVLRLGTRIFLLVKWGSKKIQLVFGGVR